MKYLKKFNEALLTNPFNPNEVWDKDIKLSELDGGQIEEFLNSLIGKTIKFLGSKKHKQTDYYTYKLIDFELVPDQDAHLVDLEDDIEWMNIYFITDDGSYEVNKYGTINIVDDIQK